MKKIIFSSPGSVILSGEYGINFGKPALVLAINRRVKVIVTETKKSATQNPYVIKAMEIVKNYLKTNIVSYKDRLFKIIIQSKLPELEIFGYSSAFYTALIASLLTFYSQKVPSQEIVNSLSYQLEKRLDKKTYGIRTSVSSFGGLIYFRKEFEFLRTISLLQLQVPKIIEKHLSIPIGVEKYEQYRQIENTIGKRYNINTRAAEQLLSELEKITKRTVLSFIKEDAELYRDCVKREKKLLQELYLKDMSLCKTGNISLRQDIKGVLCEQI